MMYNKLTINEADILKFIVKEFNTNSLGIKFSIADWATMGDEAETKSLMVFRKALDYERFDIEKVFDEQTYALEQESFVAMSIPNLNGEILALNTIKQVVYNTSVDILLTNDNPDVFVAIDAAIQEIRKKLLQYFTTYKVSYNNLDDLDSDEPIEETLKIITMSGSIDYGQTVQINGFNYLTYSMPLTLFVTNYGEFANQNTFKLGVDSIAYGKWDDTSESYWNANGVVGGQYDVFHNGIGVPPYSQYLPNALEIKHGTAGRVRYLLDSYLVFSTNNTNYTDTISGTYPTQGLFNNYLRTSGYAIAENLGKIYRGAQAIDGYWYATIIQNEDISYFKVGSNGVVKMFDIEPIEWHWGTTATQETVQLLRDKDTTIAENSYEVKSTTKSKAYAFTCDIQIDLRNELLRKLYLDSKKPNGTIDTWTLYDQTVEYNEETQTYEIATDLTFSRELELVVNQPNESLSKGEKMVFTLAFAPKLKE